MRPLTGLTILVLESEPLIAYMLQDELQDAGARVVVTTQIARAIDAIGNVDLDGAIIDIRLSGGDCRVVAQLLHGHGIAYVATSGDNMADDYGASARINKPYMANDIVAALERIVVPSRERSVQRSSQMSA